MCTCFPTHIFFLIIFVPNTSKSFCLLMLSVALLREVHWAASSVVFKMFLHFWPCFSGTKVFLSTTSLMPGFYRWLLNTGGTPLEALSLLKSPCFPLILNRAAEALLAHTFQWHRLQRDQAPGHRSQSRRAESLPHCASPSWEAAPAALHRQRHGAKCPWGPKVT